MTRKYLFLLFPLLFLSCSPVRTIVIWSDRMEMADIAELYNRNSEGYRVIFNYSDNLVPRFDDAEKKPDIVIGLDLANGIVKSEMASLEKLDMSGINKAVTGGTGTDGEVRLIPLSYNPEIILFRKDSKRIKTPAPALTLGEIRDLGLPFNEEKKKGFSPFWDSSFLLSSLSLFETGFTGGTETQMTWNRENLDKATDFLLSWENDNGKTGDMDLFNGKYMYDNSLKILKEGRILFSAMDLGSFMILSDTTTRDLDFRYVSMKNRIDPGEIVYGGIYRKTAAMEASLRFMTWLTDKSNQEEIIRSVLVNRTGSFGFLGGLSCLDEMNRSVFPSCYPVLEGKLPEPAYLLPQVEKPLDFSTIKVNLIVPWITAMRSGDRVSLDDALEKWEKLRIPF